MPDSEGTKSFTAIVPLYASAMLRVAAALVGPAEAEDAVQEASMRAWQSWSTLRNVDAVRSWLLQITLNVCRQWRRGLKGQQQAHMQTLPEDTDAEYHHLLAMLETDPGTSNHAGALDLRAAEVLSIPAGTVRSRLHRALLQMRDRLLPSALANTTRPEMEGRA